MPSAPTLHVRDLPAVAAATALVSVLPALAAAWILPPHGLLATVASLALAVALSAAASRLGAAAWSRMPGARDMLFADLMVWTWARRRVTEHRLTCVRQAVLASHPGEQELPFSALVRMGRLLEARDSYTYGHSRRVARHAVTIARGMGLPEAQVEQIRQAALLHDIGKIYTPREILEKPGRLTDEEFAVIRAHPVDGAALLSHLDERGIEAIVRHHHERLDGRGYPAGLRGEDIPLGARIVAVADTFDALTSARSYRRPQTHKKALAILAAESGSQLDAGAVASFTRHYAAGRPALVAAVLSAAGERAVSLLASAGAGLAPGAAAAAAAGATFALGHGGAARAAEPAPAPKAVVAAARPAATGTTGPALRPLTAKPTRSAGAGAATTTGAPRPRRAGSASDGDGGGTTHAEGARDAQDPATPSGPTATPAADAPAATGSDTGAGTTHAEGAKDAADGGVTHAEGSADPDPAPARRSGGAAPTTSGETRTTPSTPTTGGGSTGAGDPPTPPVTTPTVPATADVSAPAGTTVTTAATTPAVTVPAVRTPVASTPAVTVPAVTVPQVDVRVPPVTVTLPGRR